jgi:hypothetical protein
MKKETNDAMNALVQDLVNSPIDLPTISGHLTELICIVDSTESDLRDCVNEMCLRCGKYREEHLGACNGCRWKEVKNGFYD